MTTPEPEFDALAEPLRAMRLQFEAVMEPHRTALWEFCRGLTGSSWDAEDLVQETLMKAFGNLPNLWQPASARAYLFRIASNTWIDWVRRERKFLLEDIEEHDQLPDTAWAEESLMTRDAMTRLVQLLPPRQRVVLLLCETFGFRASEVAAMLRTSEGAVKAALHRSRARLAEAHELPAAPTARQTDAAGLHPVVQRYVAAFNARDADGIAALLHEDAITTIVGSAEELGREVSRASSLAEWAADPVEQWIRPGLFDGHPVLFVYYRTPEYPEALAWMITLGIVGDMIHEQRFYYFCPELIREAAARLGVPAVTHGYQYSGAA